MTGMIAPRTLADDLTTAVQVGTTTKSAEKGTEIRGTVVIRSERGTMIATDHGGTTGTETGIGTGATVTETTGTTGGGETTIREKTTVAVETNETEMIGVRSHPGQKEEIVVNAIGHELLHLGIGITGTRLPQRMPRPPRPRKP